MTKPTHTSGGFLFSLIFLNIFISKYLIRYELPFQILLIFLFFHFSNLGSVFPDIDMKGSYISKRYPLLARAFKKARHRGITHSLIFIAILYIISLTLVSISHKNIVVFTICSGFILGYTSHLALDLLTREGIELLFPFRFNIKLFHIKTGSKGEVAFHKFLKLIIFLFLIYNIYLLSLRYFNINLLNIVLAVVKSFKH